MPTSQDVYDVLLAIDRKLGLLVAARDRQPAAPPRDVDLDGQYGDPLIRAKDPRDWQGESQIGKHMSECPALYLELLANRLDYFADKEEAANEMANNGKPKATYTRLDAARARGWAARIKSGYTAPVAAGAFPSDDEISF